MGITTYPMFVRAGLAAVACLAMCGGVGAKVCHGKVTLTGEFTERYVGKFAYTQGMGHVTGNFWTAHQYDKHNNGRHPMLYLYGDEEWAEAQTRYTCVEKIKLARETHELVMKKNEEVDQVLADSFIGSEFAEYLHSLWKDRTFHSFDKDMEHTARTHYWYAFIADCSLEYDGYEPPVIHYNVTFLNPGNDHLPADEHGMSMLHLANLALLVGLCAFGTSAVRRGARETASVHLGVLLLGLACVLAALSSLCELLHLRSYGRNGEGSWTLDMLATVCEGLNDCVVSFVLVSIAAGWTLGSELRADTTPAEGGADWAGGPRALGLILQSLRKPAALVSSPGLSTAVLLLLLVSHVVLCVYSATFQDDFDKFHDYEHWPGRVLMWARCALGMFFAVALGRTIAGVRGELVAFLQGFRVAGIMWFGCMPALVAVCSAGVTEHKRHAVVTGGTLLCQSGALSALLYLFVGNRKSLFYQRSSVGGEGNLGALSGGGGAGFKIPFSGVRAHCE